jgi:hypothetical protein
MYVGLVKELASNPSKRDSYVLLSHRMPAVPHSDDPELLHTMAIDRTGQLNRECPSLSEAIRKEVGTHAPPLSYLTDRILAFWAENLGWQEPETALSFFTEILRLGILNDDRERLRTWFFWLLVLSSNPTKEQINQWTAGVQTATATFLPYEELALHVLGIEEDRKGRHDTSALDIFRTVVSLLDDRSAEQFPSIVRELAGAGFRGFMDPAQQAESMVYTAEACMRMGDELSAITYAATAGALVPSFEQTAKQRIAIISVIRDGRVQPLHEWIDAGSFAEIFNSLLEQYAAHQDLFGLLDLTEFLRRVPGAWGTILVALCQTPEAIDEATVLASALLYDFAQYDGQ